MSAIINPDCRDGKHEACAGDSWDTETDEPAECPCTCRHGGEGEAP